MEDRTLTGYPSVDRPWLKYYSAEAPLAPLPEGSMYDYLLECNRDHLSDVALIYFERRITYRQLFEQIDCIASVLAARGIQAGDTIAIVSLNTPETICTFYALNKLGVVASLESVMQAVETLEHTLKSVRARMVFVLDLFYPQYESALLNSGIEQIIVLPLSDSMGYPAKLAASLKKPRLPKWRNVTSFCAFLRSARPVSVEPAHEGKAAALMISTSGTTGVPKKVVHSGYGVNSVVWQYQTSGMVFHRGETYLAMAPLFLAFGITLSIHLPLCVGVTSIICLDVEKGIAMFAQCKPNHFLSGGYHMQGMAAPPALAALDLSFLRTIAIGGASLPPEEIIKVNDFLLRHGSPVSLITGYGMTELCATAVTEMDHVQKLGSVGIPQSRVIVNAVDVETGAERPDGETGEIMIRAPGLMLTYRDNPQETEQVIGTDEQGRRWLHTGDLGQIDRDGFVFIQGRIKRIFMRTIPSSGTICRVFPDYIERILSTHPAVRSCAVICQADESELFVPIAFVVLAQPLKDPSAILSAYVLEKGRAFNVPVRFLVRSELPLLTSGKTDYRALERDVQSRLAGQ